MRCPTCGEENKPGALICGLCRTLFVAAGGGRAGETPPPIAGPRARGAGPGRAGRGGKLLPWVGAGLGLVVVAVVAGGAVVRFSKRVRPADLAAQAPPSTPAAPTEPVKLRERRFAPASETRDPRRLDPRRPSEPARAAAGTATPIAEMAPPPPRPRRSVSPRWYEQAAGHRAALDEQRQANAPVLVYFRVDWCPYCRRMDSNVVTHGDVVRFLADVIKVRINPETSPEDRALAVQYGVKGYPSVYVIAAPGAPPEKVVAFSRDGKEDLDVGAERFLASIKGVGPGQASELVHRGSTRSQAGDLPGARHDLDRALELDPGNALGHYWRARVAAQSGETGQAVGYFKRAIALDPRNAFAHAELGSLYARASQWDQAIAAFTGLIEADRDWQQGAAFGMRGAAYRAHGQPDKAAADLAEACKRGHTRACSAAP